MQSTSQIAKNQNRKHPLSVLPSLREIEFVCPLCRNALNVSDEAYNCVDCQKTYPLHAGIPDFRVFLDRWLNYKEDRVRTEIVLAVLEKFNLEKILEHYWSFSDITPEDLRQKFIRSVMLGEQKARRTLQMLEDKTFGKSDADVRRVLEIGSGTGNFLVLAAGRYEHVVGVDIAMRWLHVSRRRFMEAGLEVPPLVCCCAEFLPFANKSFDLIVAVSTLEFVNDQEKVLAEAARTLADEGAFFINTVNRFALARDPYAYLWGVGFLPRSMQARYVRRRRNAVYDFTKTVSYRELNQMSQNHFQKKEFALPDVPDEILQEFSSVTRSQIKFYRLLKKNAAFRLLFKWIGPGWDVLLRK